MSLYIKSTVLDIIDYQIWNVDESEEFYLEKVDLDVKAIQKYKSISSDSRRLEWLAGRFLVKNMCKTEEPICVDEYGKPYLKGINKHISLSHSHGKVAVCASEKPCGIDIQKVLSKIERIKFKFANKRELDSIEEGNSINHLHVYWSAKEALYKIYGKKALDFKEHILLDPVDRITENGILSGKVIKGSYNQSYKIAYSFIDDYVLVNAVEV